MYLYDGVIGYDFLLKVQEGQGSNFVTCIWRVNLCLMVNTVEKAVW